MSVRPHDVDIKPLIGGCSKCQSLAGNELAIDMAFQPIFDLRNDNVYGYEALVRGPSGEDAQSVLSQVNDTNCHQFDQIVRVLAVKKAVSLGLLDGDAKLSINFMPRAVIDAKRCLKHVIEVARDVDLPFERIIFEFTEDERVDKAQARRISSVYRQYGFLTALDDFGSGFAGLVTLADISTDLVKVDMDLIRRVDQEVERYRIVEAVVRMLNDIGRTVAIEGIETAGELAAVRRLGVQYAQGYFLGRPSLSALQCEPDYIDCAA